jgi:hypothetical protein
LYVNNNLWDSWQWVCNRDSSTYVLKANESFGVYR